MKKEVIIEVGEEKIGFCLPSGQMLDCERREGRSLLKMVQDLSITSTVTLLKYMRRYDIPTFGHTDAIELFDHLTENGYSLPRIYEEIVQPVFVEAGLMEANKEDAASADKSEEPFFRADN